MNTQAIHDGGPAFPVTEYDVKGGHYEGRYEIHSQRGGTSLRDYFAAKALEGLLADSNFDIDYEGTPQEAAEYAYRIADAMLKAREAQKEPTA